MRNRRFAEVLLPLAIPGTFTYHFDEKLFPNLAIGQRVSVPFGGGKHYCGIVFSIHQNPPENYKTRSIDSMLDDSPIVNQKMLDFWIWMADYYLCTPGEVYRAAIPSAMLLESETYIEKAEINSSEHDLTLEQRQILECLEHKSPLSIKELGNRFEQKGFMKQIHDLFGLGLIKMFEKVQEKYKPKKESFIELNHEILADEHEFNRRIHELNNSPKQKEVLFNLITLQKQNKGKPIKKTPFQKKFGVNHNIIKELESKSWLYITSLEQTRLNLKEADKKPVELTPEQTQVLNEIVQHSKDKKPILFYGVAASGKTEVLIHWILKALETNQQCLWLVPEISLATQLSERLSAIFGKKFGLYTGKLNANEKVEFYQQVKAGEIKIVLASRTGLFLPFQELKNVIVDEEHERNYKASDRNPKFHTRDSAVFLAHLHRANCILTSSTPSIESLYNSGKNKYHWVELSQRFLATPSPKIEIINLKKAFATNQMHGNISFDLKAALEHQMELGKQSILFLNRRGYAPVVECKTCGHIPYCPNCDVSLTFHRHDHHLHCHYCGYKDTQPNRCLACGSEEISWQGIGTEQLEVEINELFPQAKIARMDVDSMRKKYAYERLLEQFESKEIDILIGTQMVTKGLDFSHVGLVGVIRAENSWSFPNYRAHEHAFESLHQLANRAGRRKQQGLVLVQSFVPDHPILSYLINNQYQEFAKKIYQDRRQFHYPPFVKMIQIQWRHKKLERVEKTAKQFAYELERFIPKGFILGPEAPPIARIRNQYIQQCMIKIPPSHSPQKVKQIINHTWTRMQSVSVYKSVRVDFEVDV